MLTPEENHHVDSAVRRLLAQPTVTPAEVAQLVAMLPATSRASRRAAMERALDVARSLRWVGMPLLEQAVARVKLVDVEAPAIKPVGPRRPAPPPLLVQPVLAQPVEAAAPEPLPIEAAAPEPLPIEAAAPEPLPVEAAAPEPLPIEAAAPEPLPFEAPAPELAQVEVRALEPIEELAPEPAQPSALEAQPVEAPSEALAPPPDLPTPDSGPRASVRFARTTGRYRTIESPPDLPPLKPGVDPNAPPPPRMTGRTPLPAPLDPPSNPRRSQRTRVPARPEQPWAQLAVGAVVCIAVAAGVFSLSKPPAAALSRSQQLRPGTAPVPAPSSAPAAPTAPGPTGSRVDVEGTVVAAEPGRVIIKSANRYYMIRGDELKGAVGSRFRARGLLTGVGRGGVVYVDTKA